MAAVAYPSAGHPVHVRPRLVLVPGGRRPGARACRRRRAVAMAAVVLVAVLAVLAVRGSLTSPGGGPLTTTGAAGGAPMQPAAAHVHVVQPGETLWSIVQSAGLPGDPRPIVDRLETQLGGRPLQVGQRLLLP